MNSDELRKAIKEKYKSLQRFATLSKAPYSWLFRVFEREDPKEIAQVEQLIRDTPNAPIFGELTPEDIAAVKGALPDDLYAWCDQNRVSLYWLKRLLKGEVRHRNRKKVKVLFQLLNLEH